MYVYTCIRMYIYIYIHTRMHTSGFFFFSLGLVTPLVSYEARCLSCDCVCHCMCGHWELAFVDVMPIAACGPLVLGLVWWSCCQTGWQYLPQSAYCALMLHLTEYHDLFTCSLLVGGKGCAGEPGCHRRCLVPCIVEQTSTCSSLPASFFLGPQLLVVQQQQCAFPCVGSFFQCTHFCDWRMSLRCSKKCVGTRIFFMLCLWSALKLRFVKENAILFALAWAGGLKLLGCAWRKWWAGAGLVSRLYGCDGLCHRL